MLEARLLKFLPENEKHLKNRYKIALIEFDFNHYDLIDFLKKRAKALTNKDTMK